MNANFRPEQHSSPLLIAGFRYQSNSLRIIRKIETASNVLSQYSGLSTTYKYDVKGHITEASTRTCHEDYMYNALGQRTYMLHTRKGIFRYAYDAEGKLMQVNDMCYSYDELGRLAKIKVHNAPAKYFAYERVKIGGLDVDRLVRFQDGNEKSFDYSYTPNNPLPVTVHSSARPVVRYQWDESKAIPRLLSCTTLFASWQFGYLEKNETNMPDSVILTGPAVGHLGYWDLKALDCKLGYDHLGTVKLIADPFNELVKELFYDSFGNAFSETEPKIHFPLGFAGGLRDIATGFVQFGFRDYDPSVGRFTTPDPAMDLRGDGDIYDYCVDDPVNFMDAAGLAFTGSGNHEPVRLEPFSSEKHEGYWRTIPEEGACKKCLEMAKQKFTVRPERPHPNCKCEIEFVGVRSKPDKLEYAKENEEIAVVKERLLDIGIASKIKFAMDALNDWDLTDMKGVHQQLFFGTGNVGFFGDGKIRSDLQDKLPEYYDTDIKYRAIYIREAVEALKQEHMDLLDMMEKVNSMLNLDMEESDAYILLANNCQHFIQKVVKLAESYAQRDGVSLRVK